MSSLTNKTSLHLTIRSRLDQLQQHIHDVCGDGQVKTQFFSSVQLWKERSLHHTLESLDIAETSSMDSHIEAMENHERGARELLQCSQVFLDRVRGEVNLHLETFTADLAGLVDNIVKSRLEEQRVVHDIAVRSLETETQRLGHVCHELRTTNHDLETRLEVLGNSPSTGGDAILCDKLRGRVQHLVIRERELAAELQTAALERVKHRRELEKTRTQLGEAQKSLTLTRAMHEKETRQLAALLQLNHAQVAQVLRASKDATAKTSDPRQPQQPLERVDPLSGFTIVHLTPIAPPQKPPRSPNSNSRRRGSSPVLVTSPIQKQRDAPPLNSRQRVDRPKSAGPRRSIGTSAMRNGKTLSSSRLLRPPPT